jgi:hypothetical protein
MRIGPDCIPLQLPPVRPAAICLLLAGCMPPRTPTDHRIRVMIQSPEAAERAREFQTLANSPVEIIPNLKFRLEEGYPLGFPCVALLYNLGEGDAVPLELKVLHAAKFRWPAQYAESNRILEPYVWNELAADLRKAGRPALRLLADALGRESPDETCAMRVCEFMLRAGGHTPDVLIDEFARLLTNDRDLGGLRVSDVAGAAILHLGYQDVALYRASELAAAAKSRLDALRGATDDVRLQMGLDALGEAGRDPVEGARWKALAAALTAEGEGSWRADRLLERRHGVRLRRSMPLRTLWDLRTARWRLPDDPQLAVKWRRWLDSRLMRVGLYLISESREGAGVVAWMSEPIFHCTEDATAVAEGQGEGRPFLVWVETLDHGTRLVSNVIVMENDEPRGDWRLDEVTPEKPVVLFPKGLRTGAVVFVEELERRTAATAPDAAKAKIVKACTAMLADPVRGPDAARALACLGEKGAAGAIREAAASWQGEARITAAGVLVQLGDPAGLDLGVTPRLQPFERERALRASQDPRLKEWLRQPGP